MGPYFVAKLILFNDPFVFVSCVCLYFCCLLAYASWVFERAYCAPWASQFDEEPLVIERCSLSSIDRSANIGDSFWGMLNMMTTLGGTMPPLTIMGRFISTVAVILGMCLLALLLKATTNNMSFTAYEKKVYGNMTYQKFAENRYATAAKLISAAWLHYKAMNMTKGGILCFSASYRQACSMDFFCTSLCEFRKVMVVRKRMESLMRADKNSRAAAAFVGGNEGGGGIIGGSGGGQGGGAGPDDKEYRKIVQDEIQSVHAVLNQRLDSLERIICMAVGGESATRRAARVASVAVGAVEEEVRKAVAAGAVAGAEITHAAAASFAEACAATAEQSVTVAGVARETKLAEAKAATLLAGEKKDTKDKTDKKDKKAKNKKDKKKREDDSGEDDSEKEDIDSDDEDKRKQAKKKKKKKKEKKKAAEAALAVEALQEDSEEEEDASEAEEASEADEEDVSEGEDASEAEEAEEEDDDEEDDDDSD
jgi:hypothetical protein